MIHFELNTIDWNAISAIATTLAFIVAFVTIIVSNRQERKNRKFQVLLLHKEQEQKQLDEMVANLLTIIDDINPLHLANYSKKIENRNITVQDREQLDKIASTDQSNFNKLQIIFKFTDIRLFSKYNLNQMLPNQLFLTYQI